MIDQLLCFALSRWTKALGDAEATGLEEEQSCDHSDGQEEAYDIQAVVLVPGELMSLHPQVLSSFVPHGELDPEYGLVFRADGPIVVDPGKPHGVLLVSETHKAQYKSFCSNVTFHWYSPT